MLKTRRDLCAWMGKGLVVLLVFAGLGLGQAAWAGSLRWRALGPEGGWAESLATAPGLEGTAFAGMAGAGVWLTTDAGSHWTRLPLPPDPDVQYDASIQYHVTADPADPRTVYVTTPHSLWSSHDRGAHWASSTFSSPISGFAVAPSNPRVLYVSGFSAGPGLGPAPIYRSVDRGATWRQTDTGITVQPYALAVDPKDPRTLYLAGLAFESSQAGRFAASHDGGLTWEVLSKQTNPDWKLAVRPGLPQVFYACSSVGIFSSSDGGRTWSTLLAARNDRCDLALDPSAPGTLYVVTNDFFVSPGPAATLRKSRDGGLTWETIQAVADHVDTLAVDSKRPARLYAGLGKGGVLKSEDGGAHWTVQAAGLLATSVAGVAVDPVHAGTLYAAAEGGIFRSGNGGATWTAAGKGLPANAGALRVVASPAAPGVLYAGAEAGFFRSLDGGESWQAAGPDLPLSPVYDVVVDAAVPNRLYAAGYTNFPGSPKPPDLPVLAVSDDGGATWSEPHSAPATPAVFSLAVDPADPAHLYAAGGTLLTSHDHGETWSALWAASFDPLAYSEIRKVVVNPQDPRTLFAVMEPWAVHKVLKSSDQGKTFTAIDAGLPWLAARDLVFDPHGSVLYAATTRGVFVSRDGGASWTPDSLGMGAVPVASLTFVPGSPSLLYAGTAGRGVFVTPIP